MNQSPASTTTFYTPDELHRIGFKHIGTDVRISKKTSIYTPANISIGSHVRIDDFCILSGSISIGSYVHISAFNALYAKHGILIGNFCGISPRCTLLTASDDFSGQYLISPLVDVQHTRLQTGPIHLQNYTQIGAHSLIMPGVTFHEGAVCGACSFVKTDLDAWSIYKGIPAKKYQARHTRAKDLGEQFYDL